MIAWSRPSKCEHRQQKTRHLSRYLSHKLVQKARTTEDAFHMSKKHGISRRQHQTWPFFSTGTNTTKKQLNLPQTSCEPYDTLSTPNKFLSMVFCLLLLTRQQITNNILYVQPTGPAENQHRIFQHWPKIHILLYRLIISIGIDKWFPMADGRSLNLLLVQFCLYSSVFTFPLF